MQCTGISKRRLVFERGDEMIDPSSKAIRHRYAPERRVGRFATLRSPALLSWHPLLRQRSALQSHWCNISGALHDKGNN